MRKVLFLDMETTGLDPIRHDVIRAAFIVEINGVVECEQVFSMQPITPDTIDLGALAVNGLTTDMVMAFPAPVIVYNKMKAFFDEWIDKFDTTDRFLPAGYNTHFDLNFLAKFFKKADPTDPDTKYGIGSYIRWQPFDLMAHLHNLAFFKGTQYKNFKLSTITAAHAIDHLAHDALSDARAVQKLTKQFAADFDWR